MVRNAIGDTEMSVIHFTPEELGPIAAFAVGNTSSDDGKRKLCRYVKALAAYSAANSLAYAHTYRETTTPYTEDEIMARARIRDNVDTWKASISTLHLLRYNLISNDGTDFSTVPILHAILSMVQDIARKTVQNNLRS